MESIIADLEGVCDDLDYGDITRNDAVEKIKKAMEELRTFDEQ